MSHWVTAPQPPLAPCPGLQFGTGLVDDTIALARNGLYDGGKKLAAFAAQQLTSHPLLKATLGVATGPLIDIAFSHYPELEKRKRKRKQKEDGSGVGASRVVVRRTIKNPEIRRFLGDAFNEGASRIVDDLANRFSKFELEHKHRRSQLKRNKKQTSRRAF